MKRIHIHLAVQDLEASIRFYSALFAAAPTVRKPDYAKWMLEDPKVNLSISDRARAKGLDHLGIQVESEAELAEVAGRIKAADIASFDEGQTTCCYAHSDKSWTRDPQGIAWETFYTMGESVTYGASPETKAGQANDGACCASQSASNCC